MKLLFDLKILHDIQLNEYIILLKFQYLHVI